MSSSLPSVSVVIPVKNEAAKIRACLTGILGQSIPIFEIIIIDSGSTDGTLDIIREFDKVKLIEINSSEFNHGLTRNLGVSNASGEFILLTVGDAIPFNKYWIEHLLSGFDSEDVAGVCGQQVVAHDLSNNPVEWFRPQSTPKMLKYKFLNKDEFLRLSPADKKRVCSWDDVTAMYRREVLLKLPFRETSYAEDAIWARDAVLEGYAIVYNYNARVFHYHLQNQDFTYKRTITTNYYRYKYFGLIPEVPHYPFRSWISLLKTLLLESKISFKEKVKWLNYNIVLRKTLQKATFDFLDKIKDGESSLDLFHQELCGKPPIPLKAQ